MTNLVQKVEMNINLLKGGFVEDLKLGCPEFSYHFRGGCFCERINILMIFIHGPIAL